MSLLSVVTSATTTYLLCCDTDTWTWTGVTQLLVTAGTSLLVSIHWQVLGSLVTLSTAAVMSHVKLSHWSQSRLVYLKSADTVNTEQVTK